MRKLVAILMLAFASGAHAQAEQPRRTLLVSAAASLAEIVRSLAGDFERLHPHVKIEVNAGASGVLAQQIEQGAPVDVFVSAGRLEVERLERGGLVAGKPVVLARNRLVVVTTRGSRWAGKPPREVLTSTELRRVACGNPASVPAGRYAQQALTAAGLWQGLEAKLVYTADVRQALAYAEQSEVDVAIVYATDALGRDKVEVLGEIPGGSDVRVEAVAARLKRSTAGATERFIEQLTGPAGAAEFQRRGFLPAEP
jgi:molybdate transport system substrate-binding protein